MFLTMTNIIKGFHTNVQYSRIQCKENAPVYLEYFI